jgi:hypothetical protein
VVSGNPSLGFSHEITATLLAWFRGLGTRKYDSSRRKVGRPRKARDIRKLVVETALANMDGVYMAGPGGGQIFRALGHLKTSEVADVVQITKVRVLKALERRGVVRVSPEALEVDDVLSARDPVLAQLAAATVAGLPPAGPAERQREPVFFAAGGEPEIVGELVVQDSGFNLRAKTRAGALDDEARTRLLRYVLRPRFAAFWE